MRASSVRPWLAPRAAAVGLLSLTAAVASASAQGSASARTDAVVLPIAFHVVAVDGQQIIPKERVSEWLERANAIFASYGIAFVTASSQALDARHAALESRADRDALSALVGRGVIDCFVVRSLRDVDDPSQMRRGVHWRSGTRRGAHFVIVSSIAGPNVLAHELGHYLGNPGHSEVAGNLMSYTPADGLPVLDARQQRRLRRSVQDYLRSGELRAVDEE